MPGETHKPEERLEGKRWWRCRVCKAQVPKSKPACSLGHLRPDPEQGINENGVQMCECKRYGPPHAWEPGESCSPERVIPAASKPPTHTPVGASDEGEWPAVKLCRSGAGHLYIPAPSMRATDAQTYHPESAPNVLTPEEAQLFARSRNELSPADRFRRDEIFDRLSSYAQKEGGDGS